LKWVQGRRHAPGEEKSGEPAGAFCNRLQNSRSLAVGLWSGLRKLV